MFGQNVLDALERIGRGRRREGALDDGDLVGLAVAGLDDRLRVLLADLDPVGADEGGRRIGRAHVDLDDEDALLLGALQQLGVGLHVRVMDDDDGGLLRDERGHGLRAGIGVPVGIAQLELDAIGLKLLLQAAEPAFRQIEIHRDRDIGDGLAGERGAKARLERLVETVRSRGAPEPQSRGGGERAGFQECHMRPPLDYGFRYRPAGRSPRCED